jgi:hypothetical protein
MGTYLCLVEEGEAVEVIGGSAGRGELGVEDTMKNTMSIERGFDETARRSVLKAQEFRDALVGRTAQEIIGCVVGSEEMIFDFGDVRCRFFHSQDCCENVRIAQIDGDASDLVGSPLLLAEEVSSDEGIPEGEESATWTFYRFGTVRGYVTVRWLGTSSGYYSESVDFEIQR